MTFIFRLGHKPPFDNLFQGFWGQEGENPDIPIPDGYCRIDLNVDDDMGWRLCFRGEVPHGVQLYPNTKLCWQVIGAPTWRSVPEEEQDCWYEGEQKAVKN